MNLEHLAGKFEEFMDWVKPELKEIKDDVKALNQFKWRVAGGAAVLSILTTLICQAAEIYFRS